MKDRLNSVLLWLHSYMLVRNACGCKLLLRSVEYATPLLVQSPHKSRCEQQTEATHPTAHATHTLICRATYVQHTACGIEVCTLQSQTNTRRKHNIGTQHAEIKP
jgi:hypothetical protein